MLEIKEKEHKDIDQPHLAYQLDDIYQKCFIMIEYDLADALIKLDVPGEESLKKKCILFWK